MFPGPTGFSIPNWVSMGSAVFAQLTAEIPYNLHSALKRDAITERYWANSMFDHNLANGDMFSKLSCHGDSQCRRNRKHINLQVSRNCLDEVQKRYIKNFRERLLTKKGKSLPKSWSKIKRLAFFLSHNVYSDWEVRRRIRLCYTRRVNNPVVVKYDIPTATLLHSHPLPRIFNIFQTVNNAVKCADTWRSNKRITAFNCPHR